MLKNCIYLPDIFIKYQTYFLCIELIQLLMNIEILSKWLLFNSNSAIFQLYHGKNKLIFNEMMMRSALC